MNEKKKREISGITHTYIYNSFTPYYYTEI